MRRYCLYFLIAVLTVSCSIKETVWDASIPPEQSAKILFWGFDPTTFNGISLALGDLKLLTIPAGTINFTGKADYSWADYRKSIRYVFNKEEAAFSCNLEGGKEYSIWTDFEYDEKNTVRIWGIGLYRDIIKTGLRQKDKFIRFIPFNPPVITD